ncbi:ABC transporter ATP-binding protein [Luedemannella helvata]|uniref:ABC transporter ATP-binding protein n=1 Tax=Luedemannella helvata TaxID=349315 RepID=A0ABP4VUA1_9ACTN
MRGLPVPDPGTPPTRTSTGYLWWLVRVQASTVVAAIMFGVVWSLAQALMPAAIGKAIDLGVTARDTGALVLWTGALLALGVLQAYAGIMRHRNACQNWLGSAYRTMQLTVRQATRLGATLPKRMATGEVVSVGMSDVAHIGDTVDILGRGAGAVVGIVTVATIMLTTSLQLGLVVVLGVPLLTLAVTLLIRPLHKRQAAYRAEQGGLTTRAADIVTGLRVLRGVGGEAAFAARYRAESQRLRAAGVRVAKVDSLLEATQVLLPGVFVALVTWLGARLTVAGDITPGQLVAFYGYAVFLMMPLRTLTEAVNKITRGHVAAGRVLGLLRLTPELADPAVPATVRDPGAAELVDPESGLVVAPGRVTAVAAARPEEATAIADRLGRYRDSDAALDGVPLRQLTRASVRDLILVADNDARLFSGRLRDELAPRGADDERIAAALDAASARDIVDALPDGLDAQVAERGREFSGGQQQRLRLSRALLADPPILVLVEPTSAVDAHTEARIAARLAKARAGRTTVVCTTSPLVLDRADRVAFVDGGRVVAEGTHRELLDRVPRYAATVTRGEDG